MFTQSETTVVQIFWNISKLTAGTELKISYFNADKTCFVANNSIIVTGQDLQNYTFLELEEYTEYVFRISLLQRGHIIGEYSAVEITKADSK